MLIDRFEARNIPFEFQDLGDCDTKPNGDNPIYR